MDTLYSSQYFKNPILFVTKWSCSNQHSLKFNYNFNLYPYLPLANSCPIGPLVAHPNPLHQVQEVLQHNLHHKEHKYNSVRNHWQAPQLVTTCGEERS